MKQCKKVLSQKKTNKNVKRASEFVDFFSRAQSEQFNVESEGTKLEPFGA